MTVKKFEFEAAHHLEGYNGKCSQVHGHTYKLEVGYCARDAEYGSTWLTRDLNEFECGMLVDFVDLNQHIKHLVIDRFDHTNLNETLERDKPTCELLLLKIVQILTDKPIPNSNVHVCMVKLYETSNSYCQWYRDPNLNDLTK